MMKPTTRVDEKLAEMLKDADSSVKMYISEISYIPRLTPAERKSLLSRVAAGDKSARDELVESYLFLVPRIATNFANSDVPLQDIIQYGNIGLMKAAESFDPKKYSSFQNYASLVIRHEIDMALPNDNLVRLPVNVDKDIRDISVASDKLFNRTGHEPTLAELSVETGLPYKKITQLAAVSSDPVSFDTIDEDESARPLIDADIDEYSPPDEIVRRELLTKGLWDALSTLNDREKEVLRLRFGLVDGRTHTLAEIGEIFNRSRERIQQIEAKALRKLRHPSRSKKYEDFLRI